MADYYGNVDYGQAYSYAGGPPAAPGTIQQNWNQNPQTGPYPPPNQYAQAPNPVGVPVAPPAYNAAPSYAQGAPIPAPINYSAPTNYPASTGYAPIPPARANPGPGYPVPEDVSGGRPNFRGPPANGRAPGPVYNKGFGGGRGYGGHGMEEQVDTVFVSGLPENTTEMQLSEFFGSIGLIKMDKKTGKNKIWIYRDKSTGKPKGEATVTFDDPPTATSAIEWFNGKDFFGSTIKVELAQRKTNNFAPRGGGFNDRDGGPRGGRGGGGGGGDRFERDNRTSVREGDWRCPNDECNNNNFAWRNECNRCKTPKPDAGGERRGGGGGPPFGERRGGPGGRPSMGSGYRGGYASRGGGRNGGSGGSYMDRPPRGPPGGSRGGPREGGRGRRTAPY